MKKRLHLNRLFAALWGRIGRHFSDYYYLKIRFRLIFGWWPDFENPQTFNEKLNWLKIYWRCLELNQFVDKWEVKKWVEKNEVNVIPSYGVWDSFDDIDFKNLPPQFVLKSTNGGGGTGVVVCNDITSFDFAKAHKQLESSMRTNWLIQREWVYYDLKPRILAEKLMKNEDGSPLVDWKFFCFDGEPLLLFYASDRYKEGEPLKFDWYDMQLRHLPIISKGYPNANVQIDPFPEFEKMKEIARKLSRGFPHVRVDLYLINHEVYFGELTFFHDGGMVPIMPKEWDYTIGQWLTLPPKTNQ